MTAQKFTVEDLMTVLKEAAGEGETVPDGDLSDVTFEDLGYDSVSLLETASRIERDLGVKLADSTITEARTPGTFTEIVNSQLAQTAG